MCEGSVKCYSKGIHKGGNFTHVLQNSLNLDGSFVSVLINI